VEGHQDQGVEGHREMEVEGHLLQEVDGHREMEGQVERSLQRLSPAPVPLSELRTLENLSYSFCLLDLLVASSNCKTPRRFGRTG
jgi:hypothetical protein